MHISSKLYVSEKLNKKQDKIINKIKSGEPALGVFIITESTNGVDVFDIYNYNLLFQRYYEVYKDLTVYGIASNKDDAYDLIKHMTDDCIESLNKVDFRTFLDMDGQEVGDS